MDLKLAEFAESLHGLSELTARSKVNVDTCSTNASGRSRETHISPLRPCAFECSVHAHSNSGLTYSSRAFSSRYYLRVSDFIEALLPSLLAATLLASSPSAIANDIECSQPKHL